ncbi:MAG: indolepyruvate ferredoxin oxidoreductase subunit alpha [Syntrophales bacterium]|jgi:indolepyruvate ferredoxin oxidoreductase alpha subunit|nr:indolepyruvate ferredoxin oxidoreductase subunit alpha [Syntrophales bacterium]
MNELLLDSPEKKMLMLGNEAIVRGAIEAGVAVATCYPGTPSSEIGDTFFKIQKESGVYFEYAINEMVAMEVAAAAAIAGVRAMCSMKHVGVNVAADFLMSLAYEGVKGGFVLVSADDPSMFSSQNEQDNRMYGKFSGLPVLEPSSIAEAKEMARYAFDLSEMLQEPVILRTTTRINHSTGVISLGPIAGKNSKGSFPKEPLRNTLIPSVSTKLHKVLLANYEKAAGESDQSPYNFVSGEGKLGIITSGVSFNYVSDALQDLALTSRVSVLRIGFSHPLPDRLIKDFIAKCEKILVVEELEPYLEEGVKVKAQEIGSVIPIKGKGYGLFSRAYEFSPSMVRKVIASYFGVACPTKEAVNIDIPNIPQRPPNLCAGCPHRATYAAMRQACGDEPIYTNDIGCYTLGVLPPLSMSDLSICMGASIGMGSGIGTATGRKVVSFIGDSTFFHSGIPGLINALHNGHNQTVVIMDNGTTSMTGFQPDPGTAMENMGFNNLSVSIEALVNGIGVKHVTVVKPFKFKKTVEQIKEAIAFPGLSVIISREICPMYEKTFKKQEKRSYFVDHSKCKNHRVCLNTLACPAFYLEGEQVEIDEASCIGCTLCVQVCPENAIRLNKIGE